MDLRCHMPWLCWEWLLSMFYMNKETSRNLYLMLSNNYVMIMIIVMFICIHLCMYVIIWHNDDCFMIMIIYVCMYVSMSLSDKVISNHPYRGMIAYARKWHEEAPILMRNQLRRVVRKNIQGRYHMVMSWHYVIIWYPHYGHYIEGYNSEMKEVFSVTCWDKHG